MLKFIKTMDEFIPTRASMAKKSNATDIQVVSYESHKPKAKTVKQSKEVYKPNEFSNDVGFDIKEAKHEVIKFGMSGFTGKRKEKAKMQLAIKLGMYSLLFEVYLQTKYELFRCKTTKK